MPNHVLLATRALQAIALATPSHANLPVHSELRRSPRIGVFMSGHPFHHFRQFLLPGSILALDHNLAIVIIACNLEDIK